MPVDVKNRLYKKSLNGPRKSLKDSLLVLHRSEGTSVH